MPVWNLGQIMSTATRGTKRNDIPISVVSFWANQAYQDIVRQTEPSFQERIAVSSTSSGENRMSLPTDFHSMIAMSYNTAVGASGSARTLHQVEPDVVDAVGFTPVGISRRFVLYHDWFELHPSPNSAYSLQIRYHSFATDLLDKSDIPSISSGWRFPIELKLEQYLYHEVGDDAREATAENRYLRHVSGIDSDIVRKQKDKAAMRVKVLFGGRPKRRNVNFDRE